MAALRELLQVYGALDAVVARSTESDVTEVVNRYVPDASDSAGWYDGIEGELFGTNGRIAEAPDDTLRTALANIVSETAVNPLTTPQKTRLLYALAAIEQVRRADLSLFSPFTESDNREPFINALAALGSDAVPMETRRATADSMLDDLVAKIAVDFTSPAAFPEIKTFAVKNNLLPQDAVFVPECYPRHKQVNGRDCVVVDTVCRHPYVSLENLKAVVNPFNWDSNYPDFFCRMANRDPVRTDGWGRVVETVGLCQLGSNSFTTALKFYPYVGTDPTIARLDYDLDDDDAAASAGGDGQVVVDRGWMNMRTHNVDRDPTKPGVWVQTKKVVHIENWDPYWQAKLVCLTGYGTASAEFLFGNAKNPPTDARPFDFLGPESGSDANQTNAAIGSPSSHFAPTAVKLWTDTTRDLTNDYVAVAEKWMAGKLTFSDLADYSATTSGRLVSTPWKFLDAMSRPRYPAGGDAGSSQGDGGV